MEVAISVVVCTDIALVRVILVILVGLTIVAVVVVAAWASWFPGCMGHLYHTVVACGRTCGRNAVLVSDDAVLHLHPLPYLSVNGPSVA